METNNFLSESDENKSPEMTGEIVRILKKMFKSEGILFIVWGYALAIGYLSRYLMDILFLTNRINFILKFVEPVLEICAIGFTIFYLLKRKDKISDNGVTTLFLWIAMFVSMMLTNVILFSVLHKVSYELQHPLFMVIIAFAIVVTGVIHRYKLVIIGGVVFAALAYASSLLALHDQLLLETIGWVIAFVIPGHLLYFKKDK